MRVKDAVGRWGEQVAVDALIAAGLVVVARNWRCDVGEIDIVARDGPAMVFCEVKTRSSGDFGEPAEAVTRTKAARLRRLAVRWLAEQRANGEDSAAGTEEIRFDVVGIVRGNGRDQALTVRHIRAAF
jgi:putative endonuclease